MTKKLDLWIYFLLDYCSRRCILPTLSRGYRLPLGRVQNPTESAQHFGFPFSLSTNIRKQEGEFSPMGSYLVSLQSAFVPSAFRASRLSRPWWKTNAAAFVALSKPRQPNRSTSLFGLVGLRLGFRLHNTPINVTTGIAVPVAHKERLKRERLKRE